MGTNLSSNSDSTFLDEFVEIVNEVFERTEKSIEFVGEFRFDNPLLTRLRQEENIPGEVCEKLKKMKRKEESEKENKEWKDKPYLPHSEFLSILEDKIGEDNAAGHKSLILKHVLFDPDSPLSHVVFRLHDGRRLMPDQLSAGEKQILIILLTALVSKLRSLTDEDMHTVFIMDEPEISLHIEWRRKLIRWLFQLNDQIQIIIATHSPMTAQQVGKGQLYYLKRERGKIELDPFTGDPKTLLLNQLVMTDAFGLDTDESKEVEEKKKQYRQLRDKASLSPRERAELDQLTADLKDLPTSGRSNLLLSEEQQNLLQKIEKELQEGDA